MSQSKTQFTSEFRSPRIPYKKSGSFDLFFGNEMKSRMTHSADKFSYAISYSVNSQHALRANQARHKVCTALLVDVCKLGICEQQDLGSCADLGDPFEENNGWSTVELKNKETGFDDNQLPKDLSGTIEYQGELAANYLLVCKKQGI